MEHAKRLTRARVHGTVGRPRMDRTTFRRRILDAYTGAFPREERWLHALAATGIVVALSAAVGAPALLTVAKGYFEYFAKYFAGLFFVSRLHVATRSRWLPSSEWGRRLKSWLFGPDDDTPVIARWERALFPNRGEVAARPTDDLHNDVLLVRLFLTLLAVLAIYTNVKVRLPFLGGFEGTDAIFQRWDDTLFGTGFAGHFERWARNDADVMAFLSRTYVHDYVWFVLLLVLLYLRRDTFSLRWLVVSVGTVYLVSILISALVPALGPCFVDPPRFAWVRDDLVGEAQHFLAFSFNEAQRAVAAGQPIETRTFAGIAAFPSLHVGHMIVVACVASRTCPIYALHVLWTTSWTFIATLAFGWHYAVDAIAGIALSACITFAIRRAMVQFESTARDASASPREAPSTSS